VTTTGPTPAPTRLATPAARRLAPAALGLLVAGVVLAGCQSGSSASGEATPARSAPAGPASGAPQGGGPEPGGGGTSGEVVQVGDGSMQVRGSDEQTTVTWTGGTTFTRSVAGTLDDITVGSCVVAVVPDGGAVTSVTVSEPVDDTCSGPGGRGDGGPGDGGRPSGAPSGWPDGAPGDAPTDLPTDLPGGAPSGAPGGPGQRPSGAPDGFGAVTVGRVTAVQGTAVTVETVGLGLGGEAADATSSTVTVSDGTTVTTTVTVDANAVEKGLCAAVRGDADDSGAVAATSVSLSEPGDDGCTRLGGWSGGPGGPGRWGGSPSGGEGQGGTDA